MSQHRSDPASPLRRLTGVRLRGLFALGVVGVVFATGTTYAAWTDTATVTGTTLTAGTIDLRVNDQDSVTGFTSLGLSAMVPGNSVAGVVTLKNGGTSPVKVTGLTASGTNADSKGLFAALTTTTLTGGTVAGTSPNQTCSGGSTFAPVTLQSQETRTVCLAAALPGSASSNLQGATTTITFTFSATSDLP